MNEQEQKELEQKKILQAFQDYNIKYLTDKVKLAPGEISLISGHVLNNVKPNNLSRMLVKLKQIDLSTRKTILTQTVEACKNKNDRLIKRIHGELENLVEKDSLKQTLMYAVSQGRTDMVQSLIKQELIYYDEEYTLSLDVVAYKLLPSLIDNFNGLSSSRGKDEISSILIAIFKDVAKKDLSSDKIYNIFGGDSTSNKHDLFEKFILGLFKLNSEDVINCFINEIVTNDKFDNIKDKIMSVKDCNGKTIFHQYFDSSYRKNRDLFNKMTKKLDLLEHFNDKYYNTFLKCHCIVARNFAEKGQRYQHKFVKTVIDTLFLTNQITKDKKIEIAKELLLYGSFEHDDFQRIINITLDLFRNDQITKDKKIEIAKELLLYGSFEHDDFQRITNITLDLFRNDQITKDKKIKIAKEILLYGHTLENNNFAYISNGIVKSFPNERYEIINARDPKTGNTPLMNMVINHKTPEKNIISFLELDPDLAMVNKKGEMVLHICAKRKYEPKGKPTEGRDAVTVIFDKCKESEQKKQGLSQQSLSVADSSVSTHQKPEDVKRTFSDFVTLRNHSGSTSLHIALYNRNYHFIQLCLETMKDIGLSNTKIVGFVNTPDEYGNTSLHASVLSYSSGHDITKYREIIKLLVDNAANPDITNRKEESVYGLLQEEGKKKLANDEEIKSILAKVQKDTTVRSEHPITVGKTYIPEPKLKESMKSETRKRKAEHN